MTKTVKTAEERAGQEGPGQDTHLQAAIDALADETLDALCADALPLVMGLFSVTSDEHPSTALRLLARRYLHELVLLRRDWRGETLAALHLDPLLSPFLALVDEYVAGVLGDHRDPRSADRAAALFQAAYLVHRVAEALNDRVERFIGVPLTHNDVMNANLVAHEVVGDRFANRLDAEADRFVAASPVTRCLVEAALPPALIEHLRSTRHALTGQPISDLAADAGFTMSVAL